MFKTLALVSLVFLFSTPVQADLFDIFGSDDDEKPAGFSNVSEYQYYKNKGIAGASQLNETVRFLTDQLVQNSDLKNIRDARIAVTSILDARYLKETHDLSLYMAENLTHELQIRGYKVIDYKLMNYIHVSSDSDKVMSRNVTQLKETQNINYVVTGTYAAQSKGNFINLRMVDMQTNVIVSTAQAFISYKDMSLIIGKPTHFESQVRNVLQRPVIQANQVHIR